MSPLLKRGMVLRAETSQRDVVVGDFLGGGGQGDVCEGTIGSRKIAVKWYRPEFVRADPTLRGRLQQLARNGPPSEMFLWPFELVSSKTLPGLGYVMPLKDARFRDMVDVLGGRVPMTFRSLVTVGFNFADAFLAVHSNGWCYRDISCNNGALDPATGEIRIFDCDNIDVTGKPSIMIGTRPFTAPEVVRQEAMPSTFTDRHSLAVLLFLLFIRADPLLGRRANEMVNETVDAALLKLYGTEPLFIFDPVNRSNAPIPGHGRALALWPMYPTSLRETFTRAFTEGLRDAKHGRVMQSDWRSLMAALRDAVFVCRDCGEENFYDGRAMEAGRGPGRCWSCGEELVLPPRLRIGRLLVVLDAGTCLFPHHVDSRRLYDYSAPIARVTVDGKGIEHVGGQAWTARLPGASSITIDPGGIVPIVSGATIHFGASSGEIRC